MTLEMDDNRITPAIKAILENGLTDIGNSIKLLINQAMLIERENYLGAKNYERVTSRTGYANGFKKKILKSRFGALELSIPQVRDGEFYPSFLERGIRSERALKISLAEMYVQGVSTRKVSAILEEMCGLEVSSTQVSRASQLLDDDLKKWRQRPLGHFDYLILDARYEKVRRDGSVADSAVLLAYGIDRSGMRHVLGTSVSLSEAGVHWRKFLESLVSRGLYGVNFIVSDAHSGLKEARQAVFPSVTWQRCQCHLQQNAQAYVTSKNMKKAVAEDIRNIFNAPNREESNRLLKNTVLKYEKSQPQLSQWLEVNLIEGLNVFQLPKSHQIPLRTSNMAERVNREIKRRTQIVNIFPSVESCERLISAIIVEISDDWNSRQRYLLPIDE